MKRSRIISFGAVCVLIVLLLAGCGGFPAGEGAKESAQTETAGGANGADTYEPVTRELFAMDTVMMITAYGDEAQEAADAAEEEIRRLDALFSVGEADSDIALLNANGQVLAEADTVALMERSLEVSDETGGAFDITIYPLMEAWGFTTQNYRIPEQKTIDSLLEHVDADGVNVDEKSGLLTLAEGTRIDLGGIAKGYTSSRIMEIFAKYDVVSGMVSLGGNVQVYRTKPDGSPWKVGIENPDPNAADYIGTLAVSDAAVITSGGYERYFEQDGKVYHHILDPKTGYPAQSGLTSVTIVSPDGTLADGLSTALFVMGKETALSYWRAHADTFDCILVEEDGTITVSGGIADVFSSELPYTIVETAGGK